MVPRPPISTLFPYTTLFRSALSAIVSAATTPSGDFRSSVTERRPRNITSIDRTRRSEEHTSELQSRFDLVCRLLLEKKKRHQHTTRRVDEKGRFALSQRPKT